MSNQKLEVANHSSGTFSVDGAQVPDRIPNFYIPAKLRNIMPNQNEIFGVGFDVLDGSATVHLRLSRSDIETIYRLTRSQSCGSCEVANHSSGTFSVNNIPVPRGYGFRLTAEEAEQLVQVERESDSEKKTPH